MCSGAANIDHLEVILSWQRWSGWDPLDSGERWSSGFVYVDFYCINTGTHTFRTRARATDFLQQRSWSKFSNELRTTC
jgi:hypothetical protein